MSRRVAIVMCAPTDIVGTLVDMATGRRGWSHVCLAVSEPSGAQWVLDIDRTMGVCRRDAADICDGRRIRRVHLDRESSEFVLRRARSLMGRRYQHLRMALQPRGSWGIYCSAVVAWCLPASLRARLPSPPCPADFEALCGSG